MAQNFAILPGIRIDMENYDNLTVLSGRPVDSGKNLYIPIGNNGISIVRSIDRQNAEEIGRWGVQTNKFPNAKTLPTDQTIKINQVFSQDGYVYASDLNSRSSFFLERSGTNLYYRNVFNPPADYSDRPLARERKADRVFQIPLSPTEIVSAYFVDIQKTLKN
ncbi:MAG: hypothetical protein WC341_16340, partial [Bacteroidales bacterium]